MQFKWKENKKKYMGDRTKTKKQALILAFIIVFGITIYSTIKAVRRGNSQILFPRGT